jgi:DNA-binding XRE family transcriptional regulator
MYPNGYIMLTSARFQVYDPDREHYMHHEPTNLEVRASRMAAQFGAAIRERRTAARMTQDQVALATGVGRRFLIDLEAGKASCYLGLSLLVAEAVGLRLADVLRQMETPTVGDNGLPPPTNEEPTSDGPNRIL